MRELPDFLEPQALLAGTMCLMSCPNSTEAPLFVRRIVANLEKLAGHPALSAEMRTVCRRLAAQWEERLQGGPAGGHGPAAVH
jgi:hypothetical protein